MRGQSKEVQDERLANGRCPVHGLWMGQVDGWYYPIEGPDYTIVGCSRKDCDIKAKAYSIGGPWELIVGEHESPVQRNPLNYNARVTLYAALVTLDKIEGLAKQHSEDGIVRFCGKLRGQLGRAIERLEW